VIPDPATKRYQHDTQTLPWDKISEKLEKVKSPSKTCVTIVFIPHMATAFWRHFHSWIIKIMALETVSHLAPQIKEQSQTYLQSGSQDTQQMHPKIDKN